MNHNQVGIPLFELKRDNAVKVFQDAEQLPDFFLNHLVDPNRVVKIFEDDPNANDRVFYYQYLKLCEEVEKDEAEHLFNNLRALLENPEFYFIFPEDQKHDLFTNEQFKRFGIEFIDLLESRQLSLEDGLGFFPIIDLVFTFLMRSLLIFNGKASQFDEYIDRNEAIGNLSTIFGLEIENFGQCIRFSDSDVFIYEENPSRVFMAYIDYPKEQPEEEENQQQSNQNGNPVESEIKNLISNSNRKRGEMYISCTAAGTYDFVDFTNSNQEQEQESVHEENGQEKTSEIPKRVEEEEEDHQSSSEQNQNGKEEFNQYCSVVLPRNMPGRIPIGSRQIAEDKGTHQVEKKEMISNFHQAQEQKMEICSEISSQDHQLADKEMMNIPSLDTLDRTPRGTGIEMEGFSKISVTSNLKEEQKHIEKSEKIMEKKVFQMKLNEQPSVLMKKNKDQNDEDWKMRNTFGINGLIGKKQEYKLTQKPELPAYSTFNTNPYVPPSQSTKPSQYTNMELNINMKGKPKLNITSQFTNSFVMQKMTEPFKQNTRITRDRARAYRKSIQNILKK